MIYAIGDIHGQLEQLLIAHQRIAEDRLAHGVDQARTIHVGDLVDRGPDSRGVIDVLIDGVQRGEDWVVLMGNHDQMFVEFLEGGDGTNAHLKSGVTWQSHVMGGQRTLRSYGVQKRMLESPVGFAKRVRTAVPQSHQAFLRDLPLWHRENGMIFVHAGIRPGFPMDAQDDDDLLWIRDEFLWHLGDHEALVVHGHTPVDEPTHYGNRLNIDTGAGWGNPLTPVGYDGSSWFALTAEGRQKLAVPKK